MADEQQSDIRWLIVTGLYVFTALWGIVQVVVPLNALLYYLFSLAIASSATRWAVVDARCARRPLLHIVQFLMFFTWPIALPAYLIWSRRLRGLGLALLHAIALTITLCAFFYTTVLIVCGPNAFAAH